MVSIHLNIEVIIGNRKSTQKEVFTATTGTNKRKFFTMAVVRYPAIDMCYPSTSLATTIHKVYEISSLKFFCISVFQGGP
jgi:hypothetical protein